MITTPNLEKFRQGDFVQYMNNVLEIITEARASLFNVSPQRGALKNATDALNDAWQPSLGSELTPEIVELDKQRDSVFSGFKVMVDNWATNHFVPEMRNAAFIISDNIAGHGDKITVMRYQQQTATINAILNDLNGELAPHVATLSVTDWIDRLTELNDSFNGRYVERAQAISGRQEGIINTMIQEVTQKFRDLKAIFEARFAVATADGSANISQFQQAENEWSTITDQYNQAVTRYAGDGDEPAPTPENPETPTEPVTP